MSNDYIVERYRRLIARLSRALKDMDVLTGVLVHGVSNTLGEEWGGKQASNPVVQDNFVNILLPEWSRGFGANNHKLAFLRADMGKERDFRFFETTIESGMGFRPGGQIEQWLFNQYNRGGEHIFQHTTAQTLDDDGYLHVDEAHPAIAGKRHWAEQNEAYRNNFPSYDTKTWPFHHRMASFRALQMRFNILWEVRGSPYNKPLVAWMGTQLGHRYDTANSAWVLLHQTPVRAATTNSNGWRDRRVNNFERWLYQREEHGPTRPTLRYDHKSTVVSAVKDDSLRYTDQGRMGPSIGFALDPLFMSGNSNSVAIKVTYMDSASGAWTLRYTDSSQRQQLIEVPLGNDNMVRTATLFVSDLAALQTGTTPDFYIESGGDVPFMFVQVLKTGGAVAAEAPQPPLLR